MGPSDAAAAIVEKLPRRRALLCSKQAIGGPMGADRNRSRSEMLLPYDAAAAGDDRRLAAGLLGCKSSALTDSAQPTA